MIRVPGILAGLNDLSQSAYAAPAPNPVDSAMGHVLLLKRMTEATTPTLNPTPDLTSKSAKSTTAAWPTFWSKQESVSESESSPRSSSSNDELGRLLFRRASELVLPMRTVTAPSTLPGYLAPEFSRLQSSTSNRTSIATPGGYGLIVWRALDFTLERRHGQHHNILQIRSPHDLNASPCYSTALAASPPWSTRPV